MITKGFVEGVAKKAFPFPLEIFGPEDTGDGSLHQFRILLQSAHILYPQLRAFHKTFFPYGVVEVEATGGDMPLAVVLTVPKHLAK